MSNQFSTIEVSINEEGFIRAELNTDSLEKGSPLLNWSQFTMKYASELIKKMSACEVNANTVRKAVIVISHKELEALQDEEGGEYDLSHGLVYQNELFSYGIENDNNKQYRIGEKHPVAVALVVDDNDSIGSMVTPVVGIADHTYSMLADTIRKGNESLSRSSQH